MSWLRFLGAFMLGFLGTFLLALMLGSVFGRPLLDFWVWLR